MRKQSLADLSFMSDMQIYNSELSIATTMSGPICSNTKLYGSLRAKIIATPLTNLFSLFSLLSIVLPILNYTFNNNTYDSLTEGAVKVSVINANGLNVPWHSWTLDIKTLLLENQNLKA